MKDCEDSRSQPVGVFDSGIGGLSVLRELLRQLPNERFIYYADSARMPYGERPLSEVADFCREITRFFLTRNVKMAVVACNTASAAGLKILRQEFPEIPFVGMEPAVKPAAEHTRCGKVGVLATAGTLRGEPYAGVVRRFAQGIEVHEQPCNGLAAMIEQNASPEELRNRLTEWIAPLRKAGIDQLALACTHYPLILPLIREIAGTGITVIDPAPAVARQAGRLLAERGIAAVSARREIPRTDFHASANRELLLDAARRFGCADE